MGTVIHRQTARRFQSSAQDSCRYALNNADLVAIRAPGDSSDGHVDDVIQHEDPAAVVNPEEASALNQQMWESAISRLATSGSLAMDQEMTHEIAEDIFMFKLNRNPEELMLRLGTCVTLQACRDALEQAGHAWKLPTGGMMFVHPWQVPSALQAMVGMKTTPSTIVASQSLEHLLQEILQSFQPVWMRSRDLLTSASRSEVATCKADGDEDESIVDLSEDLLEINHEAFNAVPHWSLQSHIKIERTFLCVAHQRASASLTHSTSDARPSGHNPRNARNVDVE
jgi:hypothetical protein